MRLPLPPSGDAVGPQALSALWQHVEGCKPLCAVMSPEHHRLLDLAVEERETLCVHHTYEQPVVPRRVHEGPEIHSRSAHRDRGRIHIWVQVRHDETVGGSRMATCHDTLPQLAMRLQRRCAGGHVHVQQNSESTDACSHAASHCYENTPSQRQAGNRPVCGRSRSCAWRGGIG